MCMHFSISVCIKMVQVMAALIKKLNIHMFCWLIFTQIIHSLSGLTFSEMLSLGVRYDSHRKWLLPCDKLVWGGCLFYFDSPSQTNCTSILIMPVICHIAHINSHSSRAGPVFSPNRYIRYDSYFCQATLYKSQKMMLHCSKTARTGK